MDEEGCFLGQEGGLLPAVAGELVPELEGDRRHCVGGKWSKVSED